MMSSDPKNHLNFNFIFKCSNVAHRIPHKMSDRSRGQRSRKSKVREISRVLKSEPKSKIITSWVLNIRPLHFTWVPRILKILRSSVSPCPKGPKNPKNVNYSLQCNDFSTKNTKNPTKYDSRIKLPKRDFRQNRFVFCS